MPVFSVQLVLSCAIANSYLLCVAPTVRCATYVQNLMIFMPITSAQLMLICIAGLEFCVVANI